MSIINLLSSLFWLITHPTKWPNLFMANLGLIILVVGGGLFITWLTLTTTKHYIFREVYKVSSRDKRVPSYVGRRMIEFNKESSITGRFVPDIDGLKKIIIVKERGLRNGIIKIYVPENIEVKKPTSDTMYIMARNLKHDYRKYDGLVPTDRDFNAIAPSEDIYTNEISSKIKVTDSEVRKATNCNPEISKYQKTSGSIPLTAATAPSATHSEEKLEEIGENIEIGDDSDKDEEDKENTKTSLGKARQDLEEKLGESNVR